MQVTKKKWDVVNDIMEKNIHQLPDLMIFDDKTASNKQEIAESFNYNLCNIANTLHQTIQPSPTPFTT